MIAIEMMIIHRRTKRMEACNPDTTARAEEKVSEPVVIFDEDL